ncbi:MAG: shikimate kinase [Flavobacterium sp.]|nr:shikimate kinase [Flavobacterium sp.]
MGSGKTIIGSKLANELQIQYFDLDDFVEKQENKSITSIFETNGELYFRKVEHLVLKQIVTTKNDFVLSLGGGTPCYANNHLFLQNHDIISIYLKTSVGELKKRLKEEKLARPLISNVKEEELEEFIAKHLFDRSFYYHQAKHIVVTDGKSIQEVVNEIKNLIT